MTSIIIPAYNAEKYLPSAIASVFSQSESDWELILVDDGSTDSTPTICEQAAATDSRIRVIHRSNGGLSAARNTGIQHARGEWIAFLDADDVLSPDFLRILHNVRSRSNSEIVAAPMVTFNNQPPEFAQFEDFVASKTKIVTLTSEQAIEKALYQTRLNHTPYELDHSASGKLFKAELFTDIKFREGTWYEDLDLFYRLWIKSEKLSWIPVPVMGYRRHEENFTTVYSVRRHDVLEVTDRLVETLPTRAARTRRFAAHCNIYLLLKRNNIKDTKTLQKCRDVIRAERISVMFNRNGRLKDRLGALLFLFI